MESFEVGIHEWIVLRVSLVPYVLYDLHWLSVSNDSILESAFEDL